MDEITFETDGSFVVKESKFINYFTGILFLAIFFGVLITRNFEIGHSFTEFFLLYIMLLVFSLIFFVNGSRKNTRIVINNIGIYYLGKQIATWDNFVTAYIRQEDYVVNSNSDGTFDKFKIVVEYINATDAIKYAYEISTTSTQDKSEYQIIAAIEHFSGKKLSYETY